jgi:hypothetical protein
MRSGLPFLVGKLEQKKSLGRPRGKWEDNIKCDLQVIVYEDTDYNLVQTGSETHQASHRVGTGGDFPGGKAAGARSRPVTSI